MKENEIFDFLRLKYECQKKNREFPFYQIDKGLEFQWFNVVIPKNGIEEAINNKLANKKQHIKPELKMLIQSAFKTVDGKIGIIHKNVSIEWRYGKEFKYGDISNTFEEVCFFIHDKGQKTNDFYILNDHIATFFISDYVMKNQWGLGTLIVTSSPMLDLDI